MISSGKELKMIKNLRNYYASGETRPLAFRINMLKRLKTAIIQYEAEIIDALYKDLGKAKQEAIVTEVGFTINEINTTIKHLGKWDKPRRVRTNLFNLPGKSFLYRDPYGVTLIIGPWNYPFHLAIAPLIGAIAGGNCAIVKPSEIAAHTAQTIDHMLTTTFDKNYIAVVQGGIPEMNRLMQERFDKIFFTGSPRVGRIIMEKAAKHLTPVVLELGGKCPTVVDKECNLTLAARRIVFGKGTNAGQTCVAPDYVLVHKEIKNELIEAIKKEAIAFYGDNPLQSQDYGKLINEKNYQRVKSYMEDGSIVFGGETDDHLHKIGLTILEVEDMNVSVMKEEIFGPILPLITFESVNELIEIIEMNPDPLAMYMFSKNKSLVNQLICEVPFGGGCINDTIMHLSNENLPFGGRGTSGHGCYHGKYTYETFTHQKSVFKGSNLVDLSVKYPPYNKKKISLIKRLMY